MKGRKVLNKVPALLCASVLAFGLGFGAPQMASAEVAPGAAQSQKAADNIYKGKVTGVSKKAKTISIEVGKGKKAKTMMVGFNEATTGMEFAKKGEAAIITFEEKGGKKVATMIKPKLAKLPKGVSELQPAELIDLVALGPEKGKYVLIDSRPAKRFAASHIPTSISIPVAKLKEKGADILPEDKDAFLIFHCGGPT